MGSLLNQILGEQERDGITVPQYHGRVKVPAPGPRGRERGQLLQRCRGLQPRKAKWLAVDVWLTVDSEVRRPSS